MVLASLSLHQPEPLWALAESAVYALCLKLAKERWLCSWAYERAKRCLLVLVPLETLSTTNSAHRTTDETDEEKRAKRRRRLGVSRLVQLPQVWAELEVQVVTADDSQAVVLVQSRFVRSIAGARCLLRIA